MLPVRLLPDAVKLTPLEAVPYDEPEIALLRVTAVSEGVAEVEVTATLSIPILGRLPVVPPDPL
jgi:hypothetical protein